MLRQITQWLQTGTKTAGALASTAVPQAVPLQGQIANTSGGFVFAVGIWGQLDRFLILGTEGGTYTVSEAALTLENARAVLACVDDDGLRLVARVAEVSTGGRAPKSGPAIYALAVALKGGDLATRRAAAAAIPAICRTGTHLFELAQAVESLGGWGRLTQRAFAAWYTGHTPRDLGYQLVKYRQRGGWSHRDVLRLAKPKGHGPEAPIGALLRYATRGERPQGGLCAVSAELAMVDACETVKTAGLAETVALIAAHRLPWEALPSAHLAQPAVWRALLDANALPLTALLRNLGRMAACGLFASSHGAVRAVVRRLHDRQALKAARVHPLSVLAALTTWQQGHGVRGGLRWTPEPAITAALDTAFYASFAAVQTTGLRWSLALDVSGSMDSGTLAGFPGLSPRIGAAAMAMVTERSERDSHVVGFTAAKDGIGGQWGGGRPGLTPIDVAQRRLDDVVASMRALPMGGTDCALPIVDALERRRPVDVFVVYTDSETWAGDVHPAVALRKYREAMGIAAKLIVVSMVANPFTIADPADPGMLDVVGFDSSAPAAMAAFAQAG